MYTARLVVSTEAALSQHVANIVYSTRACLIIEHAYMLGPFNIA